MALANRLRGKYEVAVHYYTVSKKWKQARINIDIS
jgi:hypothetical protein